MQSWGTESVRRSGLMSSQFDSTGHIPETRVDRIRDVVASLIDVVTTQGGKAIDNLGLRPGGKAWIPNVDIVETPEQVVVTVDLPGVEPDRVEILLVGNMLTIKGETSRVTGAGETVHRRERTWG